MNSPDFVRPENTSYKKEVLLRSLEDIKASIDQAIQTLDLTKTCLTFELPVYGFLTRLEAIYFGRVTYELMASYWPTPSATINDPIVAQKMNSLAKLFFQKRCQPLLPASSMPHESWYLKRGPTRNTWCIGGGLKALRTLSRR